MPTAGCLRLLSDQLALLLGLVDCLGALVHFVQPVHLYQRNCDTTSHLELIEALQRHLDHAIQDSVRDASVVTVIHSLESAYLLNCQGDLNGTCWLCS